jgi:hypothetical protein
MDLSGTVGDAWEILAKIGGEWGHPGSRALKALPDVHEGHVWTSWARNYRRGCCVVRDGHCCLGEIAAEVLMSSLQLCAGVADCRRGCCVVRGGHCCLGKYLRRS